MGQPKISVIIPVYNKERYINKCLDTILSQTLKEIEVICVNDGSNDKSLFFLRQYEAKHENIVLLNQLNSGVSYARNRGIRAASGEFVCFMDPDDYYPNDHVLEHLYISATGNHSNICGGSFSEDNGKKIRTSWSGIYSKYTFSSDGFIAYKDYQFDYGYHRFAYRREFLLENDIFFPPYIRYQDPPFFVHAMICAGNFYALKEPTYCYRWGHQKLIWNEERTSHVIMAMTDNLRYSLDNGLWELNHLTMYRFLCEYHTMFKSNLKSHKIRDLILNAIPLMDRRAILEDDSMRNYLEDYFKSM